MKTKQYSVTINAPASKVYTLMLSSDTYTEWTSVFHPTSRYEGSWQKGAKILFLATDENGNIGGMVSKIKDNITNKFISIEHLGVVKDGKEITTDPEVASWAGALENYTFIENNNTTEVKVDIDVNQDWETYFNDTWPKALNKLKEICER